MERQIATNPWLSVPLEDYEGHMSAPGVGQLSALSEMFGEALARCRPPSVAVLGIAGGNGIDYVDCALTKRILGLDVNPSYLQVVRQRYPNVAGLELRCVDLSKPIAGLEPVALVHAALVFEHTNVTQCLENAMSLVAPGGVLSVVLQLPSETEPSVGPSEFPSVQSLADQFAFVDPKWLQGELEQRTFCLKHQTRRELPSGKAFWMGVFARTS